MPTVTPFAQSNRNAGTYTSGAYNVAGLVTDHVSLSALMAQTTYQDPSVTITGRVEASYDGGATWMILASHTWTMGPTRTAPPDWQYRTSGPWPGRVRAVVTLNKRISIGLSIEYA